MNLLEMSFSGGVFIAAVIIIRAAAIDHLPGRTFLVLWEMALLRLLIPFSVPSAFSVYTMFGRGLSIPSFPEAETGSVLSAALQESVITGQGMELLPADSSPVSVWFVIWCTGTIFLAVFFAVSYLRCRMEFRTALPVSHTYAEQWLKERPLKRPVSVRQSDRILAPLTYGIFRPVILMPKQTDWEHAEQLQYVFAHEYVHICRLDALTKLVAAAALCIHWFNPFVWVMCLLFNRDMELACDESVIRQFGEKSKAAYSRMLICMEAEKSGLLPFCSSFCKTAMEERIIAIMNIKRTTSVTFLSACLTVLVTVSLFATSAEVSADPGRHVPAAGSLQADAGGTAADQKSSMSIVHESADILHYEDGSPYIHDILTNHTDQTIVETQYGMLAYDENGSPLKLHWNFLDSSAESSFENMVRSEEHLPPGQTEEYRGGWSLYDGEIMESFPAVGNGGANEAVYSLLCLKQAVFEDGTVWKNPDYEYWLKNYAGKETDVDELQNYYPHEYRIEFGGNR